MSSRILAVATTSIFIFFFTFQDAMAEVLSSAYLDSTKQTTTVDDTLQQYIKQANNSWDNQKSDLNLATLLLERTATQQSETYYQMATNFYFWSLSEASFSDQKEALKKEYEQIAPLLADSTKSKWEKHLENNDPRLIDEIIGFWKRKDPYSSTALNERLIEHWKRISYAKKHFDKTSSSPYGTDDRGTLYVRLGAPNKVTKTTIDFSHVLDPVSFEKINFELGSLIRTEVKIWEYYYNDEEFFYLFAPKDGWGEFGLRNDVLELVDENLTRVTFSGSYWMPHHQMMNITENALQYGIYKELAPYQSNFQEMVSSIESRLAGSNFNQPFISRFSSDNTDLEMNLRHTMTRLQEKIPDESTALKSESEELAVSTQVYRFLNDKNRSEYIFVVQPKLESVNLSSDSFFLSNILYEYDKAWDTVSKVEDVQKAQPTPRENSFISQISDSALSNKIFYSSELIDTTRNDLQLPNRIHSKTSAIVKSSGQQRTSFPKPLMEDKPLLISDIVVGEQQDQKTSRRLPISPSIDQKYEQGSDIMIYFESYNIPAGGYTFTYHINRKREILPSKKLKDKSEVTILREKVEGRDSQLFTINLNNLDPNSYELVFEFLPLNKNADIQQVIRKIDFEIIE